MHPRAHHIFVYATLRHALVRACVCRRFVRGTPAILYGYTKKGRTIIPNTDAQTNGLLIRVSDTELTRLDRYERVGKKYDRVQIAIDTTHAWVYVKRP